MPSPRMPLSFLPRLTALKLASQTTLTPLHAIFQASKLNFHTRNAKKSCFLWQYSRTRDPVYSKRYVATHAETQTIRIVIPDGKHDFCSPKIIEVVSSDGEKLITVEKRHKSEKLDNTKDGDGSEGKQKKLPLDAVVRVFCDYSIPNKNQPWNRNQVQKLSRSGLIIPGRRVVTNACCLEHQTHVKLKRHDSDHKYSATVLDVGTECDLALLTVKDDEFWEGVPDVEFEECPKLNDAITVAGYSDDRTTISLTTGGIKQLDIINYDHGSTILPGIQVNCYVSDSELGGPVFNEQGKCVGILLQISDLSNVTEVIPPSVVNHFIRDYEKNGKFTGFPNLGLRWLNLEDSSFRKSLGMAQNQSGVLIHNIEPTSPESQTLKRSDVLLSFDGVKIRNDGTVPIGNGQYADFSYIVSKKYNGDTARIQVLRNEMILELDIKLANHTRNILTKLMKEPLPYYIIAGFVFTPPTEKYLEFKFDYCEYCSEHPMEMLKYLSKWLQSPEERPVVLSEVLPAEINSGYKGKDYEDSEVESLNGEAVKNLKSMIAMINNCKEQYLKFQLENGKKLHLETENAKASTKDILKTYGVPSEMSSDLM